MSTYTLKSIARRGTMVLAAAALVVGAIIPSFAYADALNPLTERSLLLSSSAPGYTDTDGSGNATGSPAAVPNGTYAPAGSGPNGKKTGQTFTFKVSTAEADGGLVKAFTLQYCTSAAGNCQAPGDNGDINADGPDPEDKGDYRDGIYDPSGPTNPDGRYSNEDAHPLNKSDLDVNFTGTNPLTIAESSLTPGSDFTITVNGTPITGQANWRVTAINAEDDAHSGALTGKRNYIGLYDSTGAGISGLATNDEVVINFEASETNYITNPGSGSFFVKINTYNSEDDEDWVHAVPAVDNNNIIDGGVTVANVMTDSIHITTKVLETMSFSVGTRNRDTVAINCGATYNLPVDDEDRIEAIANGCESAASAQHGTCSPIQNVNNNRLNLGDPDAEYSLRTDRAYDVASYWRLSSNSSGGATVYYSGNTLANTVGDEIAQVGAIAKESTPGTEQFGLGFTDITKDTLDTEFQAEIDDPLNEGRYKVPTLELATGIFLDPIDAYADGYGRINDDDPTLEQDGVTAIPEATFAFLKSSNTVPEPIARNDQMVISCATAKMRYIANIGADTPAGVYTTKINYLAAPQY